MLEQIILIAVVLGFAWNLGVHYTGAVMGMPYAARAIREGPALILIAVLALLGATFASGGVQETVGLHIIDPADVGVPDAIVIVFAGGLLTLFFNYAKIPTSTIQILVSCVVGVGLAGGMPIAWRTIGHLVIIWVIAPFAAFALGYVFTHLLDLIVPPEASRAQALRQIAPLQTGYRSAAEDSLFPAAELPPSPEVERVAATEADAVPPSVAQWAVRHLPALLVLVGMAASFVMGANDVSNATGALIMTDTTSLRTAGLIGGLAIAVGALTWGRRILRTVAFDVVTMDLSMASAAQGVQALVVFAAVSQGFFTSMNQALIGAMAGTGFARGRETVKRRQINGILRGWLIGPISGVALAAFCELLVRWFGG
jgi:PiT family inorganic phosphate transporter